MELNLVEVVGHMASVMVAISLMMKNIVRLRVLNFIGCSLFVIYGLIIDASPVWTMNAFVASVNVYYLVKMFREQKTPQAEGA